MRDMKCFATRCVVDVAMALVGTDQRTLRGEGSGRCVERGGKERERE